MLERGRGTLGPSDLVGRADESNRVYFVALPNDCHDQDGEKVGGRLWESTLGPNSDNLICTVSLFFKGIAVKYIARLLWLLGFRRGSK